MAESAAKAVRRKRGASVSVAVDLVKSGEADLQRIGHDVPVGAEDIVGKRPCDEVVVGDLLQSVLLRHRVAWTVPAPKFGGVVVGGRAEEMAEGVPSETPYT